MFTSADFGGVAATAATDDDDSESFSTEPFYLSATPLCTGQKQEGEGEERDDRFCRRLQIRGQEETLSFSRNL